MLSDSFNICVCLECLQIHMSLNHEVIHCAQRNGVPLDIPSLADKLREVGYKNYFIGKYHLGNYKDDYLPTHRGFDEFLGMAKFGCGCCAIYKQ